MSPKTKTARQVRTELRRSGVSIAEWARANQASYSLTHELLAGRIKGHRGESHRIAVLLGLKDGVIKSTPRLAAPVAKKAA